MSTTAEKETLEQCWQRIGSSLLQSDGTHPHMRFNLKANPVLQKTLDKVARSYLPRCEEKFKLLDARQKLNDLMTSEAEYDFKAVNAQLGNIETKIKEFDAKLVTINGAALRTIINCYGFEQAHQEMHKMREQVEDPTKDPKSNRTKTAYHLLSPIIQHAVAAACEHSGYMADHRDDPRILDIVKTIVPRQIGTWRV